MAAETIKPYEEEVLRPDTRRPLYGGADTLAYLDGVGNEALPERSSPRTTHSLTADPLVTVGAGKQETRLGAPTR